MRIYKSMFQWKKSSPLSQPGNNERSMTHLNQSRSRMRLTCSAVRHHQKQPPLRRQQPESVVPKHANNFLCLRAVYANDAPNIAQQTAVFSIPWSLSDGQAHSSANYAMRKVPGGLPEHFLTDVLRGTALIGKKKLLDEFPEQKRKRNC